MGVNLNWKDLRQVSSLNGPAIAHSRLGNAANRHL